MSLPAVAVVGYNRATHLQRALATLAACERFRELDVTLFMDGPANPEAEGEVLAAREVARRFAIEHGARVVSQELHQGLAQSVVGAVDVVLQDNDRVIIVEDDLLLHEQFLRFQIEALDRYATDNRVFQISGFMYPVAPPKDREVLVLPNVTSWGWGTWARAWHHLERNPTTALEELADGRVRRRFDLQGAYPFSQMLADRLAGRSDSWAILWYWACFLARGVVIYPARSLVGNLGFDGSGAHCAALGSWLVGTLDATYRLPPRIAWPEPSVDEDSLRAVTRFLRTSAGQTLLRNRARRVLRLVARRVLGRGY